MQNRIHWLDNLRGLCMMAILYDHTEIYYIGKNAISTDLYVTDALYLFFIISGYFIYKPNGEVCVKHKMKSILRTLVIPYFIFTTAMALPKAVANGRELDLIGITANILTGQASWFVAALAVAEILFISTLKIVKGNIKWLLAVCITTFIAAVWIADNTSYCFWQIDNALMAMLFLLIGYAYHKYESHIRSGIKWIAVCLLAFVCLKIYVVRADITLTIWHINITNYAVFFANVAVGCLAMFGLFRNLPSCKSLEWIGKHSLVYYFLCGGVPLLVSKLAVRIGFCYNSHLQVFVVFVFVLAISTILTWTIYRYVPFVTGKSRSNRQ